VTAALCRIFGLPADISLRTGLLLSQGGEFGFVLFLTASAVGLIPVETTQVLLVSVTLTMVATPVMAYLGARFSAFIAGHQKQEVTGVEGIGQELHDHVVIAGFGRVGQTVARILSAGGISYVALDMDASRIASCRARGMPVFFGDASQMEILSAAGAGRARGAIVTIDQPAVSDRIVASLRAFFPDLPMFVRARDLVHGRRLESGGATRAVPETLEASLQLGAIAMTGMGASADEAMAIVQTLRDGDYANLDETVGE
jgi:voltage-gated potassium channel Kch